MRSGFSQSRLRLAGATTVPRYQYQLRYRTYGTYGTYGNRNLRFASSF